MNAIENSSYNWATGSAIVVVSFASMLIFLVLSSDWMLPFLEMIFLLGIGYQWISLKEKKELFAKEVQNGK